MVEQLVTRIRSLNFDFDASSPVWTLIAFYFFEIAFLSDHL